MRGCKVPCLCNNSTLSHFTLSQFTLSQFHLVTIHFVTIHFVTISLCNNITLLQFQFVAISLCFNFTFPQFHFVTVSQFHDTYWAVDHSSLYYINTLLLLVSIWSRCKLPTALALINMADSVNMTSRGPYKTI